MPVSQRQLLVQELESNRKQLDVMEEELESQEYGAAERIVKMQNIIDHQERSISFRQMHLDTALLDLDEKTKEAKGLLDRVKVVRSKALNRRFQARFWMATFFVSMIEHMFPGTTKVFATQVLFPLTVGIVTGTGTVAHILRSGLIMTAMIHFKASNIFQKIPSIV